ncbi:LLM class flavin-dependent oxidoreductase [Microbulbifer agarilyticus]|uniref:LLM class flavin-dependent oxidoreductase n=1 Tax=Microbulbifer agarilyticus TaxID=260552 RepID=UPI001C977F93|nr:LLM class flavin-dependent oxidoreductase [Microbulbifer agarilyticus]MBY6190350.1 LLM class flavin-dependent oxidoreductase [Microbulbifer agarilyticus]
MSIELGSLLMPSLAPEVSIAEGQQAALNEIALLDSLGFSEAWIGEHFTAPWEPCPAPDLLIAQALQKTQQIRLGPLGHLLPYHHPIELAHRAAYLDHMAQGRYQLGVGISALPSDRELFALDSAPDTNRDMTFESLEMMTRLWAEGDQEMTGKYWSCGKVQTNLAGLGYHLKPYTQPHPPIAIAGLTPGSRNHKLAGERGYIPVSLSVSPDHRITAAHWSAVEEGAARVQRVPNRNDWRIVRDIYVAPTDEEARELALNGMMGRCWQEFLLPVYLGLGLGPFLKKSPEMHEDQIDLEYVADNLWFVGSPETVAQKIMDMYGATGGFGKLVILSYHSEKERTNWERSLRLLTEDVLPRCNAAIDATTAAQRLRESSAQLTD